MASTDAHARIDRTIFALSSGRPPAAIAVVRDLGAAAPAARSKRLTGRLPEPRKAALRAGCAIRRAARSIDEALALWFPGPNSETGEDMAELQVHGGRAVVAGVLGALGAHRGLAAGRGGRVHPPRLRERPARSHRGRGLGRSDRRRDRGAAAAGVAPAQGPARRRAPRRGARG